MWTVTVILESVPMENIIFSVVTRIEAGIQDLLQETAEDIRYVYWEYSDELNVIYSEGRLRHSGA